MKTPEELQQRIHYEFRDENILDIALTHSSFVKENREDHESNERLEFLGDAYLDAVIGEALYLAYPEEEEGFLSRTRSAVVCEDALANEAEKMELGEYLKLGKGEEKSGGRSRKSILADALEALIGAIYLDGGYDAVKGFVLDTFGEELEGIRDGSLATGDHKSTLQEMLQQNGAVDIKYVTIDETGPDHDKTFTVELRVNGKPQTRGSGKSKKKAEQQAAKRMMEKL